MVQIAFRQHFVMHLPKIIDAVFVIQQNSSHGYTKKIVRFDLVVIFQQLLAYTENLSHSIITKYFLKFANLTEI